MLPAEVQPYLALQPSLQPAPLSCRSPEPGGWPLLLLVLAPQTVPAAEVFAASYAVAAAVAAAAVVANAPIALKRGTVRWGGRLASDGVQKGRYLG